MKLHEQNLLNMDADVNTYLPFALRNPRFPNQPITLKMLLNHTSSLSDEYYGSLDLYCWDSDCTLSLAEFFSRLYAPRGQYNSPMNFLPSAPGAEENYSNMGSALAGYIVERVAKQPFDTYCKQNIFTPLGMSKTEWRLANTPKNEVALPFNPFGPKGIHNYSFPDYPNGGLRTTVRDLSKFMTMLLIQQGTYNGVKILNPQTVDLMKKPVFANGAFGLGLILDFNGGGFVGHSGGERGVETGMFYNEASKTGFIAFTNTSASSPDEMPIVAAMLLKYAAEN
jgi:CubicO group peptidase (beta-lactamase class C family)